MVGSKDGLPKLLPFELEHQQKAYCWPKKEILHLLDIDKSWNCSGSIE